MKRHDLIRHPLANGCYLLREGGRHSVFVNPKIPVTSAVPRHNELNDFLVRKTCRDLQIPSP